MRMSPRKEEGRIGMGKGKETPTLYEELIVEILLRLPVRSLLRFKCVCKSWLSLISDPQFAKSHFDLAAAPTHRVILNRVDQPEIESFDLEASLHDDSAVAYLHLTRSCCVETWGSCRGFILFTDYVDDVLILWNPSTGASRRIPCSVTRDESDPCCEEIGHGFGYDESTDDYLIVQIGYGFLPGEKYWLPRIDIFSLKTNASYFICGSTEVGYEELSPDFSIGLFLNHSLHWLVISKPREVKVILAFNLIDRSLSEIPVPHDVQDLESDYLAVMRGCLSLCCESGHGDVPAQIWVLEEYKAHSSWTKSFDMPLVNYPYDRFTPAYFTKGGGILGASRCGRLIKLNDNGELLEDHTRGQGNGILIHYDIYRESLLSLPSNFDENEKEATKDEKEGEDEEATKDEQATEDD